MQVESRYFISLTFQVRVALFCIVLIKGVTNRKIHLCLSPYHIILVRVPCIASHSVLQKNVKEKLYWMSIF